VTPRFAALLLAATLVARPACAAVEEFSSFDAAAMEVDDENFLDHYVSRMPASWQDEWDRAPTAFRTSEGCLTAATWHQWNELKGRATMGPSWWLDVSYLQTTDPQATYEWLRLDFTRATSFGSAAVRFQPAYDKSQQDLALFAQIGDATRPLEIRGTFTFVDALNSFWEFRQALVGDHSEPYRAHPFQPELSVVSRGEHRRIEAYGKWLTPSRKQIEDPDPALSGRSSIWGSHAWIDARQDVARWTLLARFDDEQVLSAQELGGSPGDGRNFRRIWTAEGGLRHPLGWRLTAEGRYLYGDRAEDWSPPVAEATFRGLDRMGVFQLDWTARSGTILRTGLLYDRIGIARAGDVPDFSYGSRKAARAIIGFEARLGSIHVKATEGIQLDHKPYPVTFHHDKAYVQLQTAFR